MVMTGEALNSPASNDSPPAAPLTLTAARVEAEITSSAAEVPAQTNY